MLDLGNRASEALVLMPCCVVASTLAVVYYLL